MSTIGTASTAADEPTPRLVFNGINGSTGSYLVPPLTAREVATMARGEPLDPDLRHIQELKWYYRRATQATPDQPAERDV